MNMPISLCTARRWSALASAVVATAVASLSLAQCPGGVCPIVPGGADRPSVWRPSSLPAGNSRGTSAADYPAVCRVLASDGRSQSIGSGTLIGRRADTGTVLTCAHLFREGQREATVVFGPGGRFKARVTLVDEANDLAALVIARPPVDEAAISTQVAEPLSVCGYGGQGRFACERGRLLGYATARGATGPSMKVAAAARAGDSGGGVFNRQRQLVGVIWGARDGVTYATTGRPLQEFVARVEARRQGLAVVERPAGRGNKSPAQTRPAKSDNSLATFEQRLATVERRIDALPDPASLVRRTELATLVRRDQLPTLATTSQVDDLREQTAQQQTAFTQRLAGMQRELLQHAKQTALAVVRQRLAEQPIGVAGLATGKLVAAALGVGGPLGLALVAAVLVARRRRRSKTRRGRGGPRRRRFPDAGQSRTQ